MGAPAFRAFSDRAERLSTTLLANEVKLKVGNKDLRADSVLYDRDLRPRIIIEYKAPPSPSPNGFRPNHGLQSVIEGGLSHCEQWHAALLLQNGL